MVHLKVLAYHHFAKKAVKITLEVKKWIKRLIWKDLSPEQMVDYLKNELFKGIRTCLLPD
ncbi:hypothetical protein CE143_11125 [Photorhabdus luminescens]|uniref:Transposase n=1 Tax=Photorhabdus akhurstii TaxID=171438 RepID=A0ABX8LXT2_9GAMM|nr:hypothetical protein KS18_03330 [Photorhabdus luminescens]QXF33648.1 hypothetical protein B0X70_11210 [Photorhabdus akhurstii]UJD75445.1 hypothetical protein CE143_11125 [Photorhabdus luminescens]